MRLLKSFVALVFVVSFTACGLSEHATGAGPSTGAAGAAGAAGAPVPPSGMGGAGAPQPVDSGPAPPRDAGNDPADAAAPAADSGAPPSAAVGVTINGQFYPKDKVIVFLHIGHSNMAGRTDTPASMRPFSFETHPRLWAYNMMGSWVPAKEPLAGDYLTRGRAGPGMSILRTAMSVAAAPDSVMVSIGKGQDGSRGGACKNYRRGGLLYDFVMTPAKQLKGKVTFGGIFSMLVLMEIFDKPNLPRSHECMEAVANDMRADLEDPNIPFIMGDWEAGATGRYVPTLTDNATARAQLRIAQMNIPRSAIVLTDGLPMSDDHHFDLTGYKMWAERAIALIRQGGWAAWAQPEQ